MGRPKKQIEEKVEDVAVSTDPIEETPAIPEGEVGSEGQEIVNATDEGTTIPEITDAAYYQGKQIMPGSVHEVVLTNRTYIRFSVEGGVEYTLTPEEYNRDIVVQ